MRIVAGRWRSRKLVRPTASRTRPLPDRVKEALFSMLGSRYGCPGELPPITVADVFAGAGSFGLEALSRGAAACCFFEQDPAALRSLTRNIETLGAGPEAMVVRGDAWRAAQRRPDAARFDLIFLDPPYAISEDTSPTGPVRMYLAGLAAQEDAFPLVILHHHAKVHYEAGTGDRWVVTDRRRFGSNALTFFALRSDGTI